MFILHVWMFYLHAYIPRAWLAPTKNQKRVSVGSHGAIEMTKWIKVLAAKPRDLSSSPSAYTAEGENQLLR